MDRENYIKIYLTEKLVRENYIKIYLIEKLDRENYIKTYLTEKWIGRIILKYT